MPNNERIAHAQNLDDLSQTSITMNEITEVTEYNDLTKYMRPYSLGRGRGDGTEELILDAVTMRTGTLD